MKHITDAIDATISSFEDKIKIRQSAIIGVVPELLALHQLKEFYKAKGATNANSKRSKATNTTDE